MDSNQDRTANVEQQLQEQLLAGVQGNVKQQGKIRDQLRDMFNPDDYVTIANPFDHVTGWAYVDPAEEQTERPDKTTKRTTFGKPKTRVLKVGESIVIHGWEAYIALGRMFKEYAQSKGESIIIVLSSQHETEKFLEKAYGGVFDPNAQINAISAQNAAREIEKLLEKEYGGVFDPNAQVEALNAQQAAADIEANKPAPAAPVSDPLGFGAPEQPSTVGVDPAQVGGDRSVEQPQGNDVVPPVGQDDETVSQTPPADTTLGNQGNDDDEITQ